MVFLITWHLSNNDRIIWQKECPLSDGGLYCIQEYIALYNLNIFYVLSLPTGF